jgi:hypothetical protein
MSNFKEKAQVFIIGLSIGLLIAGAFFILKLDDYFKELNLYKKMSQTFTVPAGKENSENEEKTEKIRKKEERISAKKSPLAVNDSAKITADSKNSESTDTLVNKSDSAYAAMTAEDDIVVRKDELTGTKTLEVFNLDPTAKNNSKDSLLQKVSGIKDDKFSGKQMFNIELWTSPLNYKGYKMSKYKIVLYGLSSAESLRLYKLEDNIYMKNASVVYHLEPSADFKPYERITDEQIISKLK